jgi:hypothetical protein
LLAEWGYGQFAGKQLQALLDQEAISDFQPENLPELNADTPSAEQYAAVVERPLFIEGRKPIVEEAPKEVQPVEVGQIDDWQLIGVYTKSTKPMVLFRNQKEAKKYLKLNEQQNISGWTVLKIMPDQVTLQQGSQQKVVPLRKPRVQGPAANAKSPTPTKPNRPGAPVNVVPPPVPANNNPLETSNDDSE